MENHKQIEMINGCIAGDLSSQRDLFIQYSNVLLATCKRYMGNEDEAKDVLQDSFLRIFRYAHTYDPIKGNLEGWMKTICIREALRQLKKSKQTYSIEDLKCIPSVNPIAIQNLDVQEIYRLLSDLPIKQRTVFNLYVVEGYSHKEIGIMLKVEETCSRTILSRTKKVLKEKLKRSSSIMNYRYINMAGC